MSHLKIIYH